MVLFYVYFYAMFIKYVEEEGHSFFDDVPNSSAFVFFVQLCGLSYSLGLLVKDYWIRRGDESKEITIGLSGTIPSGAYENLKPSYGMVVELNEGDNENQIFNQMREHLRGMFELEVNRAKTDLIDKQYGNIRFYEHEGKKYPSVTSILGFDTEWRISEDELNQYGSRGTIVHKLIEIYLSTGEWVEPEDVKELESDMAIMTGGSLHLSYMDCSYKAFFEANEKDIKIETIEQEVINIEVGYGGRYDAIGTYKGRRAIFDFKTGSSSDFSPNCRLRGCNRRRNDGYVPCRAY